MFKLTRFKASVTAVAAVAVASGGLILAAALPASATPVCAPLTTSDHSYVSPIHGGQALDAINWGGAGSKAAACTGAVVNDNIKTWKYSSAGAAADFTLEPVGTSSTTYQLVYTPGNQVNVANPLCVSTVLDQLRAYARLRPCAGLTVSVNGLGNASLNQATTGNGNRWQDFTFPPEGDNFFQIEASTETTPFSLNIMGFGGNGTQVISWYPLAGDTCGVTSCSENEIFEQLSAA